jgi:acyl-CoA thioester hydrolase
VIDAGSDSVDDENGPPRGAVTSTIEHRVSFFETDAMTVVHHSNYVRYFELARVKWLDEHDQPYTEYVEQNIHFATTKVHAEYHYSARFDDILAVTTWLEWVRGASLCMAYRIDCGERLIASGWTEHASVSNEGKVRRIPRVNRARLLSKSVRPTDPGP